MYTNGYRIPDTTRNFQPSKGDGFGVAVNMEKKDVTWMTMLQIYLFPAAAIGSKVATSSSLHF